MMSNLKSRFTFLDSSSKETQKLPEQVALVEEKLIQLQTLIMESDQSRRGQEQERELNERFRSMTMRLHQQEELLNTLSSKVAEANSIRGKADPAESEVGPTFDVSSQVKLQMMEHRLNAMQQ